MGRKVGDLRLIKIEQRLLLRQNNYLLCRKLLQEEIKTSKISLNNLNCGLYQFCCSFGDRLGISQYATDDRCRVSTGL